MAWRLVHDTNGLASVRAAYSALIVGIVGGLLLATCALSAPKAGDSPTLAQISTGSLPNDHLERRRSEAVAVLVARCMRARGLEWQPWVEPPPAMLDPDLDPVAWAERWGFGISTMVGRPAATPPLDPNLAASADRPSDLRRRYHEALHGGDGCHARATDEVYGLRDRLLAPLRPSLIDLEARIAADPAAHQALALWRACTVPLADGLPDERPRLGAGLMERIAARIERLGTGPRGLPGLLALRSEERRVASALARCESRFEHDRSTLAAPIEAAYIADHREELERIGRMIDDAEASLPTLPP